MVIKNLNLINPFTLLCLFFLIVVGCEFVKRKKNIELISPRLNQEIIGVWKLYDYKIYVHYGLIGLETTADLPFKNALDSSSFCNRSYRYKFNELSFFKVYQDTSCSKDTLIGRWEINVSRSELILQNAGFQTLFIDQSLIDFTNPVFSDSLSNEILVYRIEKGNSNELILSQEYSTKLTKEYWDLNKETLEPIFGDIRKFLPITLKLKHFYTLIRAT